MDFWTVTYAFSLFGSVSFGYLLLRFGLPDIRTLPRQIKLGLSGFAGLLLFLFSALPAYFQLSPAFAFVIMPLIVVVSLLVIFLKNLVAPSSVARVAVPVARVAVPAPAVEREGVLFPVEKPVSEKPAGKPAKKPKRRLRLSIPRISMPRIGVPRVHAPRVRAPGIKKKAVAEKKAKKIGGEEKPSKEVEKARKAIEQIVKKKEEKQVAKPVAERIVEKPAGRPKHYRATQAEVTPEKEKEELERIRRGEVKLEEEGLKEAQAKLVPVKKAVAPKKRLSHRERYLKRRGELVEQVRADLNKQQALPELGGEQALPELGGEGIDLSDLETLSNLGDLSEATDVDLSSLEGEEGGFDLSSLAGLAETEEIPKEKKSAGCPNCGAKNTLIVYCPYCGKPFCTNCALSVKRKGELLYMQCPHCKKEVIIKAAK